MTTESGEPNDTRPPGAAPHAPPLLEFRCPPVAVLDACTLFNRFRTELLMHLARRGLFCPHWTERILGEYARNLVSRSESRHAKDPTRPVISREKLGAFVHLMNLHQPQALLAPTSASEEALFDQVSEKDRHVVAAARTARLALGFRGTARSADAWKRRELTPADPPRVGVVTENVGDFPRDAMTAQELFVTSTDNFLLAILRWAGREMLAGLAAHAMGLSRPPMDEDSYLESLRHAGLAHTAEAVDAKLRLVMPAAREAAKVVQEEGCAKAGRALTAQEEEQLRQAAYDAAYEAATEAAKLSGIL